MKSQFLHSSAALILAFGFNHAGARLTSAHQSSEPRRETFAVQVTRNPEIDYESMDQLYRHVIYDESRKKNYFLDDDGKAETYDEKRVEIEGTLEPKNPANRVASIKALN